MQAVPQVPAVGASVVPHGAAQIIHSGLPEAVRGEADPIDLEQIVGDRKHWKWRKLASGHLDELRHKTTASDRRVQSAGYPS